MNPEEKAKELLFKFYDIADVDMTRTKACALICVDEISKLLPNINETPPFYRKSDENYFQYWNEVKQEINKTK